MGRLSEFFALVNDKEFVKSVLRQESLLHYLDWKPAIRAAYKYNHPTTKRPPRKMPWDSGVSLISEEGEVYVGKSFEP